MKMEELISRLKRLDKLEYDYREARLNDLKWPLTLALGEFEVASKVFDEHRQMLFQEYVTKAMRELK